MCIEERCHQQKEVRTCIFTMPQGSKRTKGGHVILRERGHYVDPYFIKLERSVFLEGTVHNFI